MIPLREVDVLPNESHATKCHPLEDPASKCIRRWRGTERSATSDQCPAKTSDSDSIVKCFCKTLYTVIYLFAYSHGNSIYYIYLHI